MSLECSPGTQNAGLLDLPCAPLVSEGGRVYPGSISIKVAFVSTNSITQGEQVGVLWPDLLSRGVKIAFAHRTFQWSSSRPEVVLLFIALS